MLLLNLVESLNRGNVGFFRLELRALRLHNLLRLQGHTIGLLSGREKVHNVGRRDIRHLVGNLLHQYRVLHLMIHLRRMIHLHVGEIARELWNAGWWPSHRDGLLRVVAFEANFLSLAQHRENINVVSIASLLLRSVSVLVFRELLLLRHLLLGHLMMVVVASALRRLPIRILLQSDKLLYEFMNAHAVIHAVEPKARNRRALVPVQQKRRLLLQLEIDNRLDQAVCVQPVVDENAVKGFGDTRIHKERA